MNPTIQEFLSRYTPIHEGIAEWANRKVQLATKTYLTPDVPPLDHLLSVRSIVVSGDRVLMVQDLDEWHIVPGGHREAGETLEQTVRREVLEETGYQIGALNPLGFIYLRSLIPVPPDHPTRRQEFFWLVYWSEDGSYHPELMLDDGQELGSEYRPIVDVLPRTDLAYGQAHLLRAIHETRIVT